MKKFIFAAACLLALGANISAQNPEKKEPVKKECSKNDAKSCDKKDAKTCDKKDGKACDQKADRKLARRTAARRMLSLRTVQSRTAARRTPRISSRIAARSRRSNPSSNL